MGSSRLRAGLVVASTAVAVLIGGTVVPIAANAVVTTPTNLSPNDPTSAPRPDGPSPNKRTNIVLSWSAVPGATSYYVEISNGSGHYSPPSAKATTTLTSFPVPPGLTNGSYRWHVKSNIGDFSSDAWFTRGWDAKPGNPHQVSTAGPVVAWDPVPNASYYEVQFSAMPFPASPYEVAMSSNGSEENAVITCNTTATVLSPHTTVKSNYPTNLRDGSTSCTELGLLSDPAATTSGDWHWRVRARDGVLDTANNAVGGLQPAASCTGIWFLKNQSEVPPTPQCSEWAYPSGPAEQVQKVATLPLLDIDPVDSESLEIGPRLDTDSDSVVTTVSNSPVFSWAPGGDDVSFYRVILSNDADMSSHNFQWETQATSLSPLAQLPTNATSWWWTVQACAVTEPSGAFILSAQVAVCTDATVDPKSLTDSDPGTYPHSFVQVAPDNVQPVTDTAVTGGRTFVWKTLLDSDKLGSDQVAAPDPAGYEIEISDSKGSFTPPKFSRVTDAYGTTAGQSRVTLPSSVLPNGYKWRVRAIDETNNKYPWSASRQVGALQSATAKFTIGSGFALTKSLPIKFDAPVTGVSSSTVRVVATSNGAAFPGTVTSSGGTSYNFNPRARWVAGESYRLQVSGVATAGTSAPAAASGAAIRATTSIDSANPAVTKKRGDYGWATGSASDARGKSYVRSTDKAKTKPRSTVSTRVRGSKLYVFGCFSKSSGKANIYVDGRKRATVDLYRSYSKCGTVATISLTSGSQHTVTFAPTGTKRKKAKSTQVRFDGFAVS